MKKIFYFIIAFFTVVALPSCNDKDEIRKDIDELKARLDALQPEIDRLNEQIKGYYPMVSGSIYINSYVKNENGDYILKLSDGTTMTVYSGKPSEDVPTVSINEEGFWCSIVDGEETALTDTDGNPLKATPTNGTDGKTPLISVDENGYWVYSVDNGETWVSLGGEVANPEKRPGSLFSDVKVDEGKGTATFLLTAGGEPVTVPLYTNMVFEFQGGNTLTVSKGSTASKNISLQKDVADIVIESTPLGVKVENSVVTVDAKNVEAGNYKVYFRIFSENNFAKLVVLEVTVQ